MARVRVRRPDRRSATERIEDGAVDLVEAELVDLEERERVTATVAVTRPSARTSA